MSNRIYLPPKAEVRPNTAKLRAKIQKDLDDFLARGGVITHVPSGVSGAKASDMHKRQAGIKEHNEKRSLSSRTPKQ